MADDEKLTQLDALTSVTDDDIIYIVDDPINNPTSKKITVANFRATIGIKASQMSTRWEALTVGDVSNPELVFADGDCIYVEVPI